MWIPLEDLFHDPPNRSAVGDTHGLSRMNHSKRFTIASEDEGARVAVIGKIRFLSLVVIIDGDLLGLQTGLVTYPGYRARTTSEGEVGGTAIFGNDVKGFTVHIKRGRVKDFEAR